MATVTTAKQLADHSRKIDRIDQQQAEHYRILSSIDKRLTPEFFKKIEDMYEYMIVGNGKPSIKAWREDMDKWRETFNQAGNKWESRAWDIAKAVGLLIAGGFIGKWF